MTTEAAWRTSCLSFTLPREGGSALSTDRHDPGNWTGGKVGKGQTFNFGGTHIHPVGGAQFTADQVREISGQVQQGQQQTVEHITRSLPQCQHDAGQTG